MESWLTSELIEKVRAVFAPKYGRELKDSEIEEIATNLTNFMENQIKFYRRLNYAGITPAR